MTELLPNIFAFPVEADAKNFDLLAGYAIEYSLSSGAVKYIELPPGSYEILFTTKGVTEEQAGRVVDQQLGNGKFNDYCCVGSLAQYGGYIFSTAAESLQSLLKSKGLTAGNYLIIKKVDN